MKASSVHAQPVPSVSKVITRLAILGGIILGGMYAFLQICASLMKYLNNLFIFSMQAMKVQRNAGPSLLSYRL